MRKLITLAILTLLLAGCGGDSSTASPSPATPLASTASAGSQPTVADPNALLKAMQTRMDSLTTYYVDAQASHKKPANMTASDVKAIHGWIVPPGSGDLNITYVSGEQREYLTVGSRTYQKIAADRWQPSEAQTGANPAMSNIWRSFSDKAKVESLPGETLNGKPSRRLRLSTGEGSFSLWIDSDNNLLKVEGTTSDLQASFNYSRFNEPFKLTEPSGNQVVAPTVTDPSEGTTPPPASVITDGAAVAVTPVLAGRTPIPAATLAAELGVDGVADALLDARQLRKNGITKGNPQASVVIVEFSDFQCPACKAAFDDALPQVIKSYVDSGQALLVYHPYPLESVHPKARSAANAALCANEQGQFWPYHDRLFQNRQEWVEGQEDSFYALYATNLGLDLAKFKQCYSSKRFDSTIEQSLKLGNAAGLQGTPFFVINSYTLTGAYPFPGFQRLIEAAQQAVQ